MQNRGQLFWGLVVILLGVLFLIGNLTNIDVSAYCWPVALILVGLWLILRPRTTAPGTVDTTKVIGDIDRSGAWTVTAEDFFGFVMDLDLDMTQAIIPPGKTLLRVYGFVTDVELFVPKDVGVRVSPAAFYAESKINGEKEEQILASMPVQTDNYDTAERQLMVETRSFVTEISVRQL